MNTGFVVGKFYPLHLGHMHLLDIARSQCDRLIVWVCDRAQQEIPGTVRAGWIRELYPDADVRVVPDTLDDTDSAAWASYTVRILGSAPDVVFTSEDYGPVYARLMGSRHVMVDRFRERTPVSGTDIRGNPFLHWSFLAPPVRAHFAKRIVVVGAESTGTTTLARDLAAHYRTVWVPEYGREYAERLTAGGQAWKTGDFVHIASEQERREAEAARSANRYLICDTNAYATRLWHERYLGSMSPEVDRIASRVRADLYILTGDEIPFVQDGTRDGEHIRHAMHRRFVRELKRTGVPYVTVTGASGVRLSAAVEHIDRRFGQAASGRRHIMPT